MSEIKVLRILLTLRENVSAEKSFNSKQASLSEPVAKQIFELKQRRHSKRK
jgi:hypothetical protein